MTRAWVGFVPLLAYVGILTYGCVVTPGAIAGAIVWAAAHLRLLP